MCIYHIYKHNFFFSYYFFFFFFFLLFIIILSHSLNEECSVVSWLPISRRDFVYSRNVDTVVRLSKFIRFSLFGTFGCEKNNEYFDVIFALHFWPNGFIIYIRPRNVNIFFSLRINSSTSVLTFVIFSFQAKVSKNFWSVWSAVKQSFEDEKEKITRKWRERERKQRQIKKQKNQPRERVQFISVIRIYSVCGI